MKKVIKKILLAVFWVLLVVCVLEVATKFNNSVPEADTGDKIQNMDNAKEQEQSTEKMSTEEQNEGPGIENATLNFPDEGTYYKKGFGDEYSVYRFGNTDLVVYCLFTDTYLIGKNVKESTEGPSLGRVPKVDSQFVGLSDEYMLFLTKDGLMAVELEEKEETREDGRYLVHDKVPYEELTKGQKDRFIYPTAYEKVINPQT